MSEKLIDENDTLLETVGKIGLSFILGGPYSTSRKIIEEIKDEYNKPVEKLDVKKIIEEEILSKEAIKNDAKKEAGNLDDGTYTDISKYEFNDMRF